MKFKFFFKWVFVFTILVGWTFLVISSSSGEILRNVPFVSAAETTSFNTPVYIQKEAGVEMASSSDIITMLFKNDFEVQEKTGEEIPMKDCSLRGSGGSSEVNGLVLGDKGKVNFDMNSLVVGNGEFSVQDENRNRFTLKFKTKEIIKTDEQQLIVNAEGSGRLNRGELNFDSIVFILDKNTNTVSILGSGDTTFAIRDVPVEYLKGCLVESKDYFIIIDNGKLEDYRDIGEVRSLLTQHPEFVDSYEKLDRLFTPYWYMIVPVGIVS